jgi:hypothetical protein
MRTGAIAPSFLPVETESRQWISQSDQQFPLKAYFTDRTPEAIALAKAL